MTKRARGVGLQVNPDIYNELGMQRLADIRFDFAELLCDTWAGPLDSGYVIDPSLKPIFDDIGSRYPLLAHSNYGEEFGFDKLGDSAAVQRHMALARAMNSPFIGDHAFYGKTASSWMWSSQLQFSKAEIERVAGRAAALQDLYKMPLLHENAFYYATFPGSETAGRALDQVEAEFMGTIAERAQTHLLLDLHNVLSNSKNFEDYDAWRYLKTIPIDRVLQVHVAGGQILNGWYHDWHNTPVPEEVWEMLRYVVENAKNLEAVVLEVQGPAHNVHSLPVDPERWPKMIKTDLDRATEIWRSIRGEV
jgi:uncharacterized protein (UPF0276 family)